jgi:hypothetical protein
VYAAGSFLEGWIETLVDFLSGVNTQAINGVVSYQLANPLVKFGLNIVVFGAQVGKRDETGTSVGTRPAYLGGALAREVDRAVGVVEGFLRNH